MTQPVAYSLQDAAVAVGVSTTTLRREIKEGRLTARWIGKRILITPEALREWISAAPTDSPYTFY